jgi:hypothetical protein
MTTHARTWKDDAELTLHALAHTKPGEEIVKATLAGAVTTLTGAVATVLAIPVLGPAVVAGVTVGGVCWGIRKLIDWIDS